MPGIRNTLAEFKAGTLHSGSKAGPAVKSRPQAVAIAMHEAGKPKAKSKRKSTNLRMAKTMPQYRRIRDARSKKASPPKS